MARAAFGFTLGLQSAVTALPLGCDVAGNHLGRGRIRENLSDYRQHSGSWHRYAVGEKVVASILSNVLVIIAIVLNVSGVGAILGIPIAFVAWVWAIVSAATAQPQTGR